jgi:Calcineurin-like phosphoesterase
MSFVLVGDTQEHEIGGLPSSLAGGTADLFNEVTIRQPFHGLFGRKLLELLANRHQGQPLIHLGDLVDLSCQSELQRMTQVLARWQGPAAVAPGNHDGLLNGIFNFNQRRRQWGIGPLSWRLRCLSPDMSDTPPDRNETGDIFIESSDPTHSRKLVIREKENDAFWSNFRLTKDQYILGYLEWLESSQGVLVQRKDCAHQSFCIEVQWQPGFGREGEPGAMKGKGEIYGSNFSQPFALTNRLKTPLLPYTRSWLLQKVRIPPAGPDGQTAALILIDTTNPVPATPSCPGSRAPAEMGSAASGVHDQSIVECFPTQWWAADLRTPGQRGYVGTRQREALAALLHDSAEDIVVLAGHHDWVNIWWADREAMAEAFAATGRPIVYLSAHTHTGFWAEHVTAVGVPVLEFNSSSLADWPLASRVVRLKKNLSTGQIAVEAGLEPKVVPNSDHEGQSLLRAWTDFSCDGAWSGLPPEGWRLRAVQRVRDLVQSHRQGRAGFADTLAVGWMTLLDIAGVVKDKKQSPLWVRAMYADALNDLTHALDAAALAAELNAEWGEALMRSSAALRATCEQRGLTECLRGHIDRAAKLSTREHFDKLFLAYRPISLAVSDMTERQHVSYMACLASIGAHADWVLSPRRQPVHDTFYFERGVTRPTK